MHNGKLLGQAIRTAIELKIASGSIRSKADVARHFKIATPSVYDWIKKGSISKDKLPELWRYFSDVVGPEHWGLSQHDLPTNFSAVRADGDKYEKRRTALKALADSLGRGGIATIAARIGKEPNYVSRMLYPPGRQGRKRIGEDSLEKLNEAFPGLFNGLVIASPPDSARDHGEEDGYMETLAQRIKRHRERLKLTQQQVADAAHVSRVAVTKWEDGQTANLKLGNLMRLCALFDIPVEEMIRGEARPGATLAGSHVVQDGGNEAHGATVKVNSGKDGTAVYNDPASVMVGLWSGFAEMCRAAGFEARDVVASVEHQRPLSATGSSLKGRATNKKAALGKNTA